jgi:FAD/FMN-containing dehydrogenase
MSEAFRRRVLADLIRQVSSRSDVTHGRGTVAGLWSAAADEPMIRIEVGSEADATQALRICHSHGLQVAVWGGRHDIFGRNDGAGQVVLDLRRMRAAYYSQERGAATVQGGTTMRDVLAALPSDRVVVTTSNLGVGLIGAASGGGYGPLVGRYGLMCDQLVAARLVIADGSVIEADEDLLWGLRGGGSGFGVVTRATFAAHPLTNVLFAVVTVPMDGAVKALLRVQEATDAEPDRIGILPLFATGADGSPSLHVMVHWSGAQEQGRRWVARFTALPGAVAITEQWVPYAQSFNPDEESMWPGNMRWSSRSVSVTRIDEAVAGHLV